MAPRECRYRQVAWGLHHALSAWRARSAAASRSLRAIGDVGNGGDRVVDGAAGDLEAARQIVVGGAQQAELAGELAFPGESGPE